MSEEETIAWKVASYGYALVDIAIGVLSRNPLVVIDVIGLVVSVIADFVSWDWINGRTTPVDYNYEESTLYLNYDQSFKFKDAADRWHVFRALQEGLTQEHNKMQIIVPLNRDGKENWINLRHLDKNDIINNARSTRHINGKLARFKIGPFQKKDSSEPLTCTFARMTITQR